MMIAANRNRSYQFLKDRTYALSFDWIRVTTSTRKQTMMIITMVLGSTAADETVECKA